MHRGQHAAADVDGRSRRRTATAVAVLVSCLLVVALTGLAAVHPALVVALLPGRLTDLPSPAGRMFQVMGGLALALPVVAAVAAGVRGRNRAAGWFVLLTVCMLIPATAAIEYGASRVRRATTEQAPPVERCVERSGGDTRCPGG